MRWIARSMKSARRKSRVGRRDWRLAIGAGCSTLGSVCLLLAACSTAPTHVQNPPPEIPPPSAPPIAQLPSAPQSAPTSIAAEPMPTPWERLRHRFAMPGCDYSPAVQRWAHLYTAGPKWFSASLSEAMPYLLIVIDQLERRDLPGEFAFLPYVESTYTAIPSVGDRAAGMWQLMPSTAREAGLHINTDYDGRLDVYAATVAALDLIEQYQQEFGDWRLANMAFNAGENAVKPLASARSAEMDAKEFEHLRLPSATHDHLAKLIALSCVISDPARYRVTLPEPRADDELVLVEFPAPIDLRLAARLTGLEETRLHHFNPGFIHGRMPAEGPFHLLIPLARRTEMERTLGKLPQYAWRDWHEATLKQTETLDTFAIAADLDASALSTINHVDERAELPPGTHLLLPGRGVTDDIVTVVAASAESATAPSSLVVHAGDTVWDIARRYSIRVDDLLSWNNLKRTTTLRLGQKLRMTAPDTAVAGTQ
jgi:membrane-bound lytic murein transglycosylase D